MAQHFGGGTCSVVRSATAMTVALVLAVFAALATLTVLAAPDAEAGDVAVGGVTSVAFEKDSYPTNSILPLHFDWAVADGTKAGDTFSLSVPDEFTVANSDNFDLYAPDGTTVVAHAAWSGNKVVFTMTDFAKTHRNVKGSGLIRLNFNFARAIPGTTIDGRFQVGANTLTSSVTDEKFTSNGTRPASYAVGYWARADQGLDNPHAALLWDVQVPGGPLSNYQLVDSVGPHSAIDCTSVVLRSTTTVDKKNGVPVDFRPVPSSRYRLTCSSTTFTVTIPQVGKGEFIDVDWTGSLTDITVESYSNSAVANYSGSAHPVAATVARQKSFGTGTGDQAGAGAGAAGSAAAGVTTGKPSTTDPAPNLLAQKAASGSRTPVLAGAIAVLLLIGLGGGAWLLRRR